MAERLTTVEFKRLHSLSDSTFKRLVSKLKTEYPDEPLIERQGAKDWVILRLDLLEDAIKERTTSAAIGPVQAEIVNDQPAPIIPFTNGFKANSALSFTTTSSTEISAHILDQVEGSGSSVAESLQAYFNAVQEQDEQLGLYIGAKRLEKVLGTADKVFAHGLGQHAKSQGLGKKLSDEPQS